MNLAFRSVLLLLLALWLAGGGYAWWQAQARQRALLAAFPAADAALRPLNGQRAASARATTAQIRVDVCNNESQKKDLVVWRTAQQLADRTRSLTDTLRQLRTQTTTAENDLERTAAHLNRYMAFTGQAAADSYYPFVASPKEMAGVMGWFGADYRALPVVVRRAVLTRLESQVHYAGAAALSVEARKVGAIVCGYNSIVAQALAPSQTVGAGAEYQAQLMLASGNYFGPNISMQANGTPLPVDARRGGQVSMVIPEVHPDQPDTLAAEWRGSIRVGRCLLPDTVWHLTVPYLIVKKPLAP